LRKAARFPRDTFAYLKPLQGVKFDSDAVSFHQLISANEIFPTERKTVAFKRTDGSEWTVEELVAMQFSYIKEIAESVAGPGEVVRDAVIVVPPYFTQFERDAVADALEISGMKLVAMINDGTAVALNYAMARTFKEEKEWHVIFDAGASATRATVVSFQQVTPPEGTKEKKNSKAGYTQVTIAGVGYDRAAGGTELDRRLRDMLADDFKAKTGKDVRGDVKAMQKLWKEAMRVKAILSANTEAMSTMESLAFDIDYRFKVTRKDFENWCEDLKGKFAQPIVEAIAKAGLTLDDISSVILTGGHSRTPMVKAAVEAAVGKCVTNILYSVNQSNFPSLQRQNRCFRQRRRSRRPRWRVLRRLRLAAIPH
jgi:hypoxia up-regulated 1